MYNYVCTTCNEGRVRSRNISNYETLVKDARIIIPLATLGVCDHCGAETVSRSELKKWSRIAEKRLSDSHVLLEPGQITGIRERLNLTVAFFAKLLGSTRQSVHNWERPDRKAPQLRSIDLLLRLVDESESTGTVNVIEYLGMQANELEAALSGRMTQKPDVRRISKQWDDSATFRFLPKEVYDRNFDQISNAPDLPLLTVQ